MSVNLSVVVRKLIYLSVVILIIIGLMPLGVGVYAKHQLQKHISDFNQIAAGQEDQTYTMTVVLTDYHQGWLRSHADLAIDLQFNPLFSDTLVNAVPITLHEDATPDETLITLHLPTTIQHGPILKTYNGFGLGLASVHAQFNPNNGKINGRDLPYAIQQNHDLITLDAIIEFNHNLNLMLQTAQLSYQSADTTLSWAGMRAELQLSNNGTQLSSNWHILPFNLHVAEHHIQTSEIEQTTTHTKNPLGFWTGQTTLTIPHLTFNFDLHPNLTMMSIKQLEIQVNNQPHTIQPALVDTTMTLSIDKIQTEHLEAIGPLTVTAHMNNLDFVALSEYQNNLNNDQDDNAQALIVLGQSLLQHQPSFTLDNAYLHSPYGTINVNVEAELNTLPETTTLPELGNAIAENLNLRSDLSIETNDPFFSGILFPLTQMNLLQRTQHEDQNIYFAHLELENRKLNLNEINITGIPPFIP